MKGRGSALEEAVFSMNNLIADDNCNFVRRQKDEQRSLSAMAWEQFAEIFC